MLNLLIADTIDIAHSDVRHGVGLFETIRICNGIPLRLDAHIKRLASGARFLGMDLPPRCEDVLEFLIAKTDCAVLDSGVARLLAVDKSLYTMVNSWKPDLPSCINIGLSINHTRFSRNMLTRFKTISYLENRLMASESKKLGLYEVVALNEFGHLTDGSRTNIFLVINGQLVTPPVIAGALPGVMRGALLDTKLACEVTITADDLEKVEAAILTNALNEIITVHNFNFCDKKNYLDAAHPIIMNVINIVTHT
jgi:branched-subunit amino acid aminotransferase/4-amino-4-deoxychorismate lyase